MDKIHRVILIEVDRIYIMVSHSRLALVDASIRNAKELIDNAFLLSSKESFGHAYALGVLSFEEFGKSVAGYYWYLGMFEEEDIIELNIFSDHLNKQVLALNILTTFVMLEYYETIDSSSQFRELLNDYIKGELDAKKLEKRIINSAQSKNTIEAKNLIEIQKSINKFEQKKSWNELLKQVFGETNVKDLGYYTGEEGFENAVREAKEFEHVEGRLPKSNDLMTIKTKVTEGYWRDLSIFKWNDFLKYVFNEINVDKHTDYSLYEGKKGLVLSQNETLQFKNKHKKNPRISNLKHIARVIENGTWLNLGVSNWNEFLLETTREINMQHNKYVTYKGQTGLKKAQQEAKMFEKIHDRLPKRRDLKAINQAIMNGYWQNFGINRFNDFLKQTFGKINMKTNGYYKGKQGLSRALREARSFKIHGKLPVKRDMRSIYNLITDRWYWKELGINNWEILRIRY